MFVVLLLAHNTKATEQIYKNLDLGLCKTGKFPAGKLDLFFEVPSFIGYPKHSVAVQESDIGIATDLLGINHYPVYKNKEMNQFYNPACVFR